MRTQQERREQNTEVTARTLRDSTESVAMWIIVALFALSLLPILYVGLYTHPTGDDFWYGQLVMKAWREQHSVFACLGAAFTTIKEFYYTWQGTCYSIFLFCIVLYLMVSFYSIYLFFFYFFNNDFFFFLFFSK